MHFNAGCADGVVDCHQSELQSYQSSVGSWRAVCSPLGLLTRAGVSPTRAVISQSYRATNLPLGRRVRYVFFWFCWPERVLARGELSYKSSVGLPLAVCFLLGLLTRAGVSPRRASCIPMISMHPWMGCKAFKWNQQRC